VFAFIGAAVAASSGRRCGPATRASPPRPSAMACSTARWAPSALPALALPELVHRAGRARLAYALQNARFQSVWPALVGHPRGRSWRRCASCSTSPGRGSSSSARGPGLALRAIELPRTWSSPSSRRSATRTWSTRDGTRMEPGRDPTQ
jgi:hypothetical protein